MVSQLVSAQGAAGWSVSTATPADARLSDGCAATGGRAHVWEPGPRPGPGLPRTLSALRAVVRAVDPDLVHLHSSMAGLCGRVVVRRQRATLFQPHSWSFWARGGPAGRGALAWERTGARWTDAVLCVGEDERRAGAAAGVRSRFVVVPNGVDLQHWAPGDREAARAALGLDDAPLVVCVGRLHRQKGQHLLLDAWPQVLAAVPDARLALVGSGPDADALQARRPARTCFAGGTEDVRPWLVAATVVAQPSVWEGMPLSVLEAMASARSVVATDVDGMRGLLGGGGVLVPRAPAALAEALVARLRDPAAADEEGRDGRRRAEQEHDGERRLAEVLELSWQLVEARR